MNDLRTIPLSAIRENPVALRTVNRKSEDYLGLIESMRIRGFLGSITVRERVDPETGETYFELCDGLHRYSAAKDAGLQEINVQVTTLSDDEVQEAQIMLNVHKVETKPIEYTEGLKNILTRHPLMTERELASKLGKSVQWIEDRLSLGKIDNKVVKELINEGKICLSNAYALASLPAEDIEALVTDAQVEEPKSFVPKCQKRLEDIKRARREGQRAAPQTFQPVQFLQKMGVIKSEFDKCETGRKLLERPDAPTSLLEAYRLGVAFTLHFDPISIEAQREDYEERQLSKEEQKRKSAAKRAIEREVAHQLKLEEAAAKGEESSTKIEILTPEEARQILTPEEIEQIALKARESVEKRKASAAAKKEAVVTAPASEEQAPE